MKTHFVSFSGGQTSGLMALRIRDKVGSSFDKTHQLVFANTGRENDATLDYVHQFETDLGFNIVWVEYDRVDDEHAYKVVNYDTAARRGDTASGPFDKLLDWSPTLPNVRQRKCSGQLKERTMRRWIEGDCGLISWDSYIGIRADEAHRAVEIHASSPKKIRIHCPLIDDGTTFEDVNTFWDNQTFKLNLPNYAGNCDLCFLKAKWKRIAIMRQDPKAANWWIEAERKAKAKGAVSGQFWIDGVSYKSLQEEASHPELSLDLDTTEMDIPCSCVVGGFRDSEEVNL